MAVVEYEPGSAFPGRIGRTAAESSPAWPAPVRAREGAPNVLLFVLDDVGYGQLGCFGGLVDTPNIDRVAAAGLRYANMHTTSLCSPSRSCILTGRNHHSNGVACVMELATGYPGYDGRMPFTNGMLPETLLEYGFNTFALGKWHLSPSEENTAAGPFHRWPLGRGFERFYGFLGGETNQWFPDLIQDNASVTQPAMPEEGYHLSRDLADQAIRFVLDAHVNAPEKPFFLYYATGCGHAPHHAPADWIERYRGTFDDGWDAYRQTVFARQLEMGLLPAGTQLPPHDPDVPPWDGLTDDQRRLYARMMEVYAAFLSYTDHHFGRVLDTLERIGELDNTLVMIVSDNGASSEGGPTGSVNEMFFFNQVQASLEESLERIDELGGPSVYNHYPWGWTWAGDTPFRRWKSETYRGGTTDPFIVSWPAKIKGRGDIRRQYAHLIDIMPTILDALDLEPVKTIRGVPQSPLEGVSFAHTFADPEAPTKHTTQYFEMMAHRAIDHEGWRAVCPWPAPSHTEAAKAGRRFGMPITPELLDQVETTSWELYHIETDPTESTNVAAEHPAKLRELITLWWAEAGKYQVLPLDGSLSSRIATERPKTSRPRNRYVYYSDLSVVPFASAPSTYNRPYSIEADVEIPEAGAEGVLFAQGGSIGGQVLYLKDNQLRYVHNYVGRDLMRVESRDGVTPGHHTLRYEFQPTGEPDLANGKGTPGRGQLYIDGVLVGNTEMPHTTPFAFSIEGTSVGYDFGEPVLEDYAPPFEFTGTINQVTVDVSGDLIEDDDAVVAMLMAQQ